MAQVEPPKIKRTKRGFYPSGDDFVPAVTKVIGDTLAKKQLRYWYAKVGASEAKRISQQSMDFGSSMHKIIAGYLSGGQMPMVESMATEIRETWEAWLDWWEDNEIQSERVEEILLCKDYGGTVDLIGEGTIVDWKFGNGIYESYEIQLGAYNNICNMSKGKIVRIERGGKNLEVVNMSEKDLKEAGEVFRHLLAVFNWKNK